MYSEEEFFRIIEERTGRKLTDCSFGFITGTSSPFIPKEGMVSAERQLGYMIWKRDTDSEGKTTTVELKTPGMSIDEIVTFLNEKNEDIIQKFKDKGFAMIDHTGEIINKTE